MRVDTLAEDKSGGLLCLHMYLRLGIPCGPVVRTLSFPC